jgi:hypothetical protein
MLKIGYFAHWNQPPYRFVEFMQECGIPVEKIDYTHDGYLEKYDVVLIEQNGFNDYIENDEIYIHEWVKRGGILLFLHQDYQRWAPCFLPKEVGYIQLIHRYFPTICSDAAEGAEFTNDTDCYMTYLMPWIEPDGQRLFSEPNKITPDEMLNWRIAAHSFRILRMPTEKESMETVRTAAESCYLANEKWDVLGSFMDPGVRDGALILRSVYGKGMFFLNQILFPEMKSPEAERCFAFWKKYLPNLLAYFERFKQGEKETVAEDAPKELPLKKNYKLTTHMHSLDWYGCDASPGTINALMRYMGYDICALSLKDNAPYEGKLDTKRFSDDHVLFLDGQEYHPFNWNDKYDHIGHAVYHMLSIGVDPDSYTLKYTRSLFSDAQVDAYLKEAIDYIHQSNGVACATHPFVNYWYEYDYDIVDVERMQSLVGTDVEKYWLSGRRIGILNAVDLFGTRKMYDNPAVNFIYLNGERPCRDSVVKALRAGHTIAAAGFDQADIMLNNHIPGNAVSLTEATAGTLRISAKLREREIRKIRVYSGAALIYSQEANTQSVKIELPLRTLELQGFVRVEIEGPNPYWICCSTPFYLEK